MASAAEKGLLVADFQIAPDEEEEEFAVVPEFGGVDELPAAGGFDEGAVEGFGGWGVWFRGLRGLGLQGGRGEGGDLRGRRIGGFVVRWRGRADGYWCVSGNGSPGC